MNEKQALAVLEQMAMKFVGTRQEHVVIQDVMTFVKDKLLAPAPAQESKEESQA